MKIEIIAIGNELTSGRILNTTSSFAARRLFEAGYEISAMHTIGDSPILIGEALNQAIDRVDAVIVTGGLGATDDDLTNEAVSLALNRPTELNPEVLSHIRSHLDQISTAPVGKLEKLALLPSGAEVLNPSAKISGYRLVHNNKPIYFLPGIPSQMKQLMIEHVLPGLATWGEDNHLTTCQRIFRIFNLQESEVNARIATLSLHQSVQIGYYPVFPEVHLSLLVRDREDINARKIFEESCRAVDSLLGESVYGHDRDTLESIVGSLLTHSSLQLAVAESCTGGLIGQRISNIPGSSAYFLGGIISYANSLKMNLLDVPEHLLQEFGAVSEQTARAMADGAKTRCKADLGLSVTGIAGPDGGSPQKPVGTVYIGLADAHHTWVEKFLFTGNRRQIRDIAAHTALNCVRKYLLRNQSSAR